MASLLLLPGALGHRRAAHLLRRSSFRYTKARVDQMAAMTATDAVTDLLVTPAPQMEQPVYDDPDTPAVEHTTWLLPTGLPLPDGQPTLRQYLTGWWLHEALNDPGITHRMALFFHQFMAASILAFGNQHYFDYLRLLKWGALGNFKKLAAKMIVDNSMLLYLNNHDNLKSNPNENFAREFLELFTIGKGPQLGPGDYTNYTEDDIAQAARVFTGFRARSPRDLVDPENGIPRGRAVIAEHDTGDKTFSDKFQQTKIKGAKTEAEMWNEIGALVDMIFVQDATAITFCRRLYRWLVGKKITTEIEEGIIIPLAETFRSGNYEIKPVLAQLLQSQHFFDADDASSTDEIIGALIKSPLDMALHTLSFFEIQTSSPAENPHRLYFQEMGAGVANGMLVDMDFPLFLPSDVAGYPAYYQEPVFSRVWFTSRTIVPRYKFPVKLLTGTLGYGANADSPIYLRLQVASWVKNSAVFSNPADPEALVQDLLKYLFPEQASPDRFNYFYQTIFLNNLPPADWTYEWEQYLKTGDDTEVKIPLEKLIRAVLASAEFQTY